LLTESRLPLEVRGGEVIVGYLGADDQPWLRALIEVFDAYAGKRVRQLRDRLSEPLAVAAPWPKRQMAAGVLWRMFQGMTRAPVQPPRARAALFAEGAGDGKDRGAALRRAAAGLGVTAEQLWRSLFADVPAEREIVPPAEIPSPTEVALRTNLAIVQELVRRSALVRIRAEGNLRALVRLAKLRGLICTVADEPTSDLRTAGTCLELSGPLSLFRRTLLYGRALAELVPLLAWCPRFQLQASCVVRGESARLVLANGAPIFPGREPRRFDSLVEERFARAFARAAPEWELVREPDAFRAGGMLVFPDFLVRHRKQPGRRFLLEIVGFWTREYLDKKLAALRASSMPNLILCIDEDRNCSAAELPLSAKVIRYRRRLHPASVLELIERNGEWRADGGDSVDARDAHE
jgi:uncharacterized protein